MAIREIIQLGEKGGDIILKTFQRINTQKEKFAKPVTTKLASMYDKSKEPPKKPETETEKSAALIKEKARGASDELNNLAKSASSFNPTQFSMGILDTVRGVANKLAIGTGGALGGAWGKGAAEAATAVTDSMAELINTGAQMATNALSEIKNAQVSAIDTMQKESRFKYYGGGALAGNQRFTLAEKSGIVEAVSSRFGKVGSDLSKAIDKLLAGNTDMQQASEIASGNFQALGTDQGYFLQQISDSIGNLPPTMKQAIQAQLIPMAQGQLIQQPEEVTKIQESRAALNKQDLEAEKNRARIGLQVGKDENGNLVNNAQQLNKSLNDMTSNLVNSGSKLIRSLDAIVSGINGVIEKVNKSNPPMRKDT